jgi:hypothetical protein
LQAGRKPNDGKALRLCSPEPSALSPILVTKR